MGEIRPAAGVYRTRGSRLIEGRRSGHAALLSETVCRWSAKRLKHETDIADSASCVHLPATVRFRPWYWFTVA